MNRQVSMPQWVAGMAALGIVLAWASGWAATRAVPIMQQTPQTLSITGCRVGKLSDTVVLDGKPWDTVVLDGWPRNMGKLLPGVSSNKK
jgi:anaerobic selenocysteine-containing dehydrogenase